VLPSAATKPLPWSKSHLVLSISEPLNSSLHTSFHWAAAGSPAREKDRITVTSDAPRTQDRLAFCHGPTIALLHSFPTTPFYWWLRSRRFERLSRPHEAPPPSGSSRRSDDSSARRDGLTQTPPGLLPLVEGGQRWRGRASKSPCAIPQHKWVRDRAIPIPPRCRTRVNALDLPASPFRAPGDALAIAPGGGRSVSYAGAGRNALKLSSPKSRKWRSRNRPLSARLLRLNLMHRRRMRIQRSKRRKVLPTSENVVAK